MITEFLALILLMIIMVYFRGREQSRTQYSGLYWRGLLLSVASSLLNILSVYLIDHSQSVPLWLNMGMNSAYFAFSLLTCSVLVYYLCCRVMEFVFSKDCLRWAALGLAAIQLAYTLLVLWNLSSGVLFWFDAEGQYRRGPLNQTGYLAVVVEILVLLACYARNRSSVGAAMRQVVRLQAPLVLLGGLLQVLYPQYLLNGIVCALMNLIIYVSFQSRSSERDSLTRIGNRRSFVSELALRTGSGQQFQCILVGLRQFSQVNQQFGYACGDKLLYQVAARLNGLLAGGSAFRVSNVEFVVLCPYTDAQAGLANLEQVRALTRSQWDLDGAAYQGKFQLAELTCRGQGWTADQIIEYLEYAFRLAKEEKLDLVRFDGAAAHRYQRRMYLIETMRRAIADRRFQVWYQPIYHKDTGRLTTAEALLRLNDYKGQPVSPGEFVPILESTGMLDEVSWILLDEVCRLLGSGAVPGLKAVSVNLSMQQFLRTDLIARIEASLDRYQVAPERLKFEVTERVTLEDIGYTRGVMEEMTRRELRFYLDDFGTGYSNLSAAMALPFETIKLDRTLVKDLDHDPGVQLMVKSLIEFFHCQRQTVVAEGVETQGQAQQLMDYGADRIQGFYYARPMPEAELIRLFREQGTTRTGLTQE